MPKEITVEQVKAILKEAKSVKLPPPTDVADATQSISLSGFKTAWPTIIRPIVLAVINFLQLFHLSTYATYVATAVAFIDAVVGGGVPPLG